MKIRKEDALAYHSIGKPGKIEVIPTKVLSSQIDLALAYSPGVAEPCKEISEKKENAYKYTAKGNLVAVITNGSAVLGLGNIGPEASKPVMEGKGVLFKKFAGIDVFDIEVDAEDPDDFIKIVKSLEPTFGGINLEDIKAPESFRIERELREKMNIPVMHDDQHGTAIISAAGLLNALELIDKDIGNVNIVINGAGAAAIACANLYEALGADKKNIVMLDRKGVIRKDREQLDEVKGLFATSRDLTDLEDSLQDADVFIGLSTGNLLSKEQVRQMAENPIVFALANPDPEISWEDAMDSRDDIIMATGRSDHPNQINNVLGFPYIFRGALDVRATSINEEMKLAAVKALAQLAKEPVPDLVRKAYGDEKLVFGREYLIPKPLDTRLITKISPAVAKAAIDSNVAQQDIDDWDKYEIELQQRIGINQKFISGIISRAQRDPQRVVFAEADNYKVLKAAQIIRDEQIATPILLGIEEQICNLSEEYKLGVEDCRIIDTAVEHEKREVYGKMLYEKRKRKGLTPYEGKKLMFDRNYFGAAMVETGEADALISGLTKDYAQVIRPALHVIGVSSEKKRLAGMYILNIKNGIYIFADATVNVDPDAQNLLNIIESTVDAARFFDIEPRIAVLSYSNFGSSKGKIPNKVRAAARMAKERYPELIIEGDIQANTALNTKLQKQMYPFSELAEKGANTFIFPDLASGNIAYKLLMELGGAEALGPILLGMKKPVHILQLGSSVREIVNMVAIAVVDAQSRQNK